MIKHLTFSKQWLILCVSLCSVVLFPVVSAQEQQSEVDVFEPTIQKFEENDKTSPPPTDAILFTGSSSIVFWRTLKEDMAPLTVINRGFGGSQMFQLNMYRDRIVTPYRPKAVLIYEGDNDVAAGKSVESIIEEYTDFLDHLKSALPDTSIYLIAVKPSIRREALWPTMQQVNQALQNIATDMDHVQFLDIATPMLLDDGSINPELFVDDELHMNAKGYAIWTSVIRPVLVKNYGS